MRDLCFDKVSLWVQVHDIPICFMKRGVVKDLCEAIGTMEKSMESVEVKGGSFIRVRVLVDVSLPLCYGHIISLE